MTVDMGFSGSRPLNPIDEFILWIVSVLPSAQSSFFFWIFPSSEWDTKFRVWEMPKENILVKRIDR